MNEQTGPVPLDETAGLAFAARAAVAVQLSIIVTDARAGDDPIIWVNAGFCQLTGYSSEEVLGRNCRFLQGPNTDPEAVGRLVADLAAGRTASETLLNYQKDGTPFWNRMVITPIRDQEGCITHHMSIQTDATDQVLTDQARDTEIELMQHTSGRLELLSHVAEGLSEHLDFDRAANALADIAVPPLATWGYIALLDERGDFDRVHVAVADPAKADLATRLEELDLTWLELSTELHAALHAEPDDILMPAAVDLDAVRRRVPAQHFELFQRLGTASRLIVPLFARDQVLGLLVLIHDDPRGLDVHGVVTAAHLGRRAGLVLDNVRLYQAERDSALTLQHRLLPQPVDVPGLDVAASYLPSAQRAEVGGDWFDVLPLPSGAVALTIGDVAGHDIAAAAAMGQLSSLLRARQWGGDSPADALRTLAALLTRLDLHDVASLVCLRWRTTADGARVEYANAGHPAPFLRLPDGTVSQWRPAHMLPVGLGEPLTVGQDLLDLPAGSTLVLYTDGLVERRDRSLCDGLGALARALRDAPDGSAADVRDHLIHVLVDEHAEDDVCLLVVRPG